MAEAVPPVERRRTATLGWPEPALAATALLALALAALVVWPLARLAAASVAEPRARATFAGLAPGGELARLLLDSVALASASAVMTVALGFAVAYALACTDLSGRRFVGLALVVPLGAPPFVASLGLLVLAGATARPAGGIAALVVAQVLTFLPPAVAVLRGALAAIDADLEEVAESLGAGRLAAFRRVTLPLSRPALAAAALMVFVLSLTDLSNPLLVGGGRAVLATEIYARAVGAADPATASALAVVLAVPSVAAALAAAAWLRSAGPAGPASGVRGRPRPVPGLVRWPLGLVMWGTATAVLGACALVPLGSLVRSGPGGWAFALDGWRAAGLRPLATSLAVAAVAGLLGGTLALTTAWAVGRGRWPGAEALRALARVPAVLPGPVVGLAYLVLAGGPGAGASAVALLAASVVAWQLPGAVEACAAALGRVERGLEEVALSLGAGRGRVLGRVVAPLLVAPARAACLHFFVSAMVSVSTVIFLAAPGQGPGAVAVLETAWAGQVAAACALATLLGGVVAAAVLALRVVPGGGRPGPPAA